MSVIIPLIHNYCDRWCEKCRFSAKCGVGISETQRKNKYGDDQSNESLWATIGEQFQKAIAMIEKDMKDKGIVITKEEREAGDIDTKNKLAKYDNIRETNILAKITMEYSGLVGDVLDNGKLVDDYRQKMEQQYTLGILSKEEIIANVEKMNDIFETIQWFRFFIHVKFMRALGPTFEIDDEVVEDIQSDKNGSAKVAILAAESSLGAWHAIYADGYEDRDDILDIMAILGKILRYAEKEFPDAKKFVRPGFDVGWQEVWNMDEEE